MTKLTFYGILIIEVEEMYENPIDIYRDKIKDAIWSEFLIEFRGYELKNQIEKIRDKFLDVYSIWLKARDEDSKLNVIRIAIQLGSIDKDFDISKLFTPL